MTEHEWEDLGPVYPGDAPIRGRYWNCGRCGMRVRSNSRPRMEDDHLCMYGPNGSLRLHPKRYPTDCDVSVVKKVMES